MATRQLIGSSRLGLFGQLIVESTVLTFISFLIAMVLAFACLPYANNLLQTQIDLPALLTPVKVGITFLVLLSIGFVTGLLPAILISRTKAIDVVKGTFRQKTKMVFSKFFITFQNAITIALIVASFIMMTQVDHMIKAPLGYNTKNIINIPVMGLPDKTQKNTLINELKQLASVSRATLCDGTPFDGGINNTIDFEGKSIPFQVMRGDSTFVSILGIEIIRENHVTSDNAFYLSQYALKEENLPEDAETFTYYNPGTLIAGVIKDIQLNNILQEKKPLLLLPTKIEDLMGWSILVETQGDPYTAFSDVKQVYERIARVDFPGKFIDQQVQDSFTAQMNTSKIVSIFCGVAILLSLLGLLAMSTYFIQQRSREIGVRKVFGSNNSEILLRLISTFLSYVLVAFIIAAPIIWYIMKDWLSGYSYRIELSPLFFVVAGLSCLSISFITVFWQSYIAANRNPVSGLKTE